MVTTSRDRAPGAEQKIGLWLEEFTAPYYAFVDAGMDVIVASPCGGQPPIDPASGQGGESIARFKRDSMARLALSDTLQLEQIVVDDFSCAFYCGGPAALWDYPDDVHAIGIVRALAASAKPLGMVSFAPAALCKIADAGGRSIVAGRRLTCIPRTVQVKLNGGDLRPFCLERELVQQGAHFTRGPAGRSYVVRDGWLITGQNSQSALRVAHMLLATRADSG
jgi:putative intracellular protease/amidase